MRSPGARPGLTQVQAVIRILHTMSQFLGVTDPRKLRELAGWYRAFSERAGSPAIWEARLLTAHDLESEANRIEAALPSAKAALATIAVSSHR